MTQTPGCIPFHTLFRFGVQKICEFYGSTEGPVGLLNPNSNDYGAGAVGRHGPLLRKLRSEIRIIKIDPATHEPIKDKKNGFCIETKYDEPGELLMGFEETSRTPFNGYFNNEKATNSKIMRNVFKKGDSFFATGDLVRMNSEGLIFFCDRLGDTFRWHGENVATTEVAKVMSTYPDIAEANVYGTLVPKHDGRAGTKREYK